MKDQERLYFVAILPSTDQQVLVADIKQHIASKYGLEHALKSPPHITIYPPFPFATNREKHLVQVLNDFVKSQESFCLKIDGFGKFPPKVIYLRVSGPDAMMTLHENFKERIEESLPLIAKVAPKPYRPHMTVATRIPTRELFHTVWNDMKNRDIGFDFLADALCLLRHNGRAWDVIHQLSFGIQNND